MASVVLGHEAIDHIARLADFLAETDPAAAAAIGPVIVNGLRVLEIHPLIGVKAFGDARELIISRGRSGYLALYTFNLLLDQVVVHAVRHQRESGFDDD